MELGDATPELDMLAALAKTFGVTADELLSQEERRRSGSGNRSPRASPTRPGRLRIPYPPRQGNGWTGGSKW